MNSLKQDCLEATDPVEVAISHMTALLLDMERLYTERLLRPYAASRQFEELRRQVWDVLNACSRRHILHTVNTQFYVRVGDYRSVHIEFFVGNKVDIYARHVELKARWYDRR